MSQFTNAMINSIAISSLYMLVAIGFTLIFGVGGVLNLAHGGMITTGAFTAYLVSTVGGHSIYVGTLAAIAVTGFLGLAVYKGVIQIVEEHILVLILTLMVTFILQNLFRLFVTRNKITVPLIVGGNVTVAGSSIQNNTFVVFIAAWMSVLALFYFINNTKTGKAIIATSMNQKGAALVGIKDSSVNIYTWGVGSMMAGFAGVLLTAIQTGHWTMGMNPMTLAFSIVVLGGLGSIRGSIVGAHVIGFVEVFTTTYVNSTLTGVTPLLILVVVLLTRPEGLYGREVSM